MIDCDCGGDGIWIHPETGAQLPCAQCQLDRQWDQPPPAVPHRIAGRVAYWLLLLAIIVGGLALLVIATWPA
jgi:hypothetical protein